MGKKMGKVLKRGNDAQKLPKKGSSKTSGAKPPGSDCKSSK